MFSQEIPARNVRIWNVHILIEFIGNYYDRWAGVDWDQKVVIYNIMKKTGWLHPCQRFTLKHLKDFGFGRAGLEGVIQGEVKTIIIDKLTMTSSHPNLKHMLECHNHNTNTNALARLRIWSTYSPSTMAKTSGWKRSFAKDFFFNPKTMQVFGIPVINVLWTIVAGQRFNFKDPKAQRLMELLNR